MLEKSKRHVKKHFRLSRKKLGVAAVDSDKSFEQNVLKRLPKLKNVWRPLTAWLLLMVLIIGCIIAQIISLGSYYQTLKPVGGGIYTEGILGSFTNANPVYATNEVDKSVSKLLFSSLFTQDSSNRLVGDLAVKWSVDSTGKVYTVQLRDNLVWHDGQPLTSEDVVFTYQVIQNPDAQSPLRTSWEGIQVTAKDKRTVVFTLPNPLASFMDGVTNGIIPKHLLGEVPMVGVRSSGFNTRSPVGSGPFMWQTISVNGTDPARAEETIGLIAFDRHHRGAPQLKSFVVRAFGNQAAMVKAYEERELTAMSGLREIPKTIKDDQLVVNETPITAATMTFFKTTGGVLADAAVRRALVAAASPGEVIKSLGYSVRPVREPLLVGQLGYDPKYAQKTGDPAAAVQALDAAGWVRGTDGVRAKGGQKLRFVLSFADKPEYRKVASVLQKQWQAVGAAMSQRPLDEASFRTVLSGHNYDAVLYGITIGVDPDVYVYWASSQADVLANNRLNLSEYKSTVVDDALDAGRTRSEAKLRAIKYQAFLQQWQQDAPALGLYQPRYLYLSRVKVYGYPTGAINMPTDRLNNVEDWMIRTARVTAD